MDNLFYLFWTGGWDSTFRLLDLSINCKQKIQPIYIVERKNRKSAEVELEAMESIRNEVIKRFPFTGLLLLPTKLVDLNEIDLDQNVLNAFDTISEDYYLGGQYVYLASFCKSVHPVVIEIGIIKQGNIYELLQPYIEKIMFNGFENYAISAKDIETEVYGLFGSFHFPLIDHTKNDLKQLAAKYNFSEILEMSWSCHNPQKGKIPCGTCPPCCYAIEGGFGYRFPFSSKLRYYLSIKRRMYSELRRHPKLFQLLRKFKQTLKGKRNIIK